MQTKVMELYPWMTTVCAGCADPTMHESLTATRQPDRQCCVDAPPVFVAHNIELSRVVACSSHDGCPLLQLQPTCRDRDLLQGGNHTWTCPAGTLPNAANALAGPPSDALCCTVGAVASPFTHALHAACIHSDPASCNNLCSACAHQNTVQSMHIRTACCLCTLQRVQPMQTKTLPTRALSPSVSCDVQAGLTVWSFCVLAADWLPAGHMHRP